MAFQSNLSQLREIAGASALNWDRVTENTVVTGVTTDTRTLERGNVFLALVGERFNGHDFVHQAFARGAIAAIVSQPVNTDQPLLQVEDTLAAYQAIARAWRLTLRTLVIAITGSVGKTTTKELIAAALGTQGRVLKTQANYNNEIGVPKTLLELDPDHAYAVIEMGMRGPGEIALLTQIAQPDVAVITNVGTAHIGRLGSEQAIAEAKCELLAELAPNGIAVLNYDNQRLVETAAHRWSGRTLFYGLEGGDVWGRLEATQVIVDGVALPLPFPGRHNALNLLAAVAVMRALDLDWTVLAQGIAVTLPQGRAQRRSLPQDILILDETYNAGLESMLAALAMLADTPGQRHIAVLGTMKELGDRSLEFHAQVGRWVRELELDHLVLLADPAEAAALGEGATPVPTEQFTDHNALIAYLNAYLQPGDRVLFKASRAMALDTVVDKLQQLRQSDLEQLRV